MFLGFYWDEPWVIALLVASMVFAGWASISVKSTFNKYSKIRNARNLTGAEAADRVLRQNGVTGVRIERISGHLSDYFDPRTNTIRLSDSVYSSTAVSAVGVAAHEAGHAVQYAKSYAPMKLRAAIIPLTNIGSQLSMPLIIIGFIFSSFSFLITLGILLFSVTVLFQLVTLPVEFDASRRAMVALREGHLLGDDELKMARKTLTAAAMTYVAALAVAVVQLIRLITRYGGRND